MIKKLLLRGIDRLGYSVARKKAASAKPPVPGDILDEAFLDIYRRCEDKTLTAPDALYSLYCSVVYAVRNGIPGDFVECGVWKGGSAMLIAHTLKVLGITDRKIYLFDTFEGMPPPGTKDIDLWGNEAELLLRTNLKSDASSIWCCSSLEEVKANLASTGFAAENLVFVEGKVEDSIPANAPAKISLLRLDTDWFESTYHELQHLYPRLSPGGVLIIDDYGHWRGARAAVDRYFSEQRANVLLNRINYTVRLCVKN